MAVAGDPGTVEFVAEQMAGAVLLRHVRMFGEYGIWCDGKLEALVCDNQLFFKPTSGAPGLLPGLPMGSPYPGAKPMVMADAVLDDPTLLAQAVARIAAELPEPKRKNPQHRNRRSGRPGLARKQMNIIRTIPELEAHQAIPGAASTRKVALRMTAEYRAWIARSRFCILTTVGPEGSDDSTRGDDGPVVTELDPATLALPDWHGNDRIDSLRNIVRDGRVSLMFMVAGPGNVVRVNGRAVVSADEGLRSRFARDGKLPRTVIMIAIGEISFQCARALKSAGLWRLGDRSDGLPSAGQILASLTDGSVGGPDYDREWPERATQTMW